MSTVKAIEDLKVNFLTIHISSGLDALKAVKKISGKNENCWRNHSYFTK